MTNNWVKQGNNYFLREVSQNTPKMEKGVYKVNCNLQTGEIYVTEIQQSFDFPYKIYGMENKFIDRVIRTYNETTGNMGMLLNGVKGTGKTVTSKQICNKLNLPVLLIHEAYNGLPSFLNEVQQDVVVLIDEFEKIYADRDHTVLTVMDGVMDNGFRKVFILTTNSLYVNDNLIQRPGRIRYLKTYSDLTLDVITEIVDDKLIHTEHRKATIDFLSNLETITVDIVKAIVEEVNIHNESPEAFGDIFNIKRLDDSFNVYEMIAGKDSILVNSNVSPSEISPRKFSKRSVGSGLYIYNEHLGDIRAIMNDNTVIVEKYKGDNEEGESIFDTKQYYFENTKTRHGSFYAF